MNIPKLQGILVITISIAPWMQGPSSHTGVATGPGVPAASKPRLPNRFVSGGVDYLYGGPYNGSLEECKTTYSPANQNAMFYRQVNGGIVDMKVVDNVRGITTVTPMSGVNDIFMASSDLGDNFAYTGQMSHTDIRYTTNSGTTWHVLPLPATSGYTTNYGVEWPYQMFFGPDGKLYVLYFTRNAASNGQLNLFIVPRTTSGTPVGQHHVINSFAAWPLTRFISAVPMADRLAVVYSSGNYWLASDFSPYALHQWYTLAWGANPTTQGQHGWIGEDISNTGGIYATNGDKIWLATDGGVLYTLSLRGMAGSVVERVVQKLTLVNGALPDAGTGAPGYPITDLTSMPGTDISSKLGDMQYAGGIIGPVMFFDAMRITNPANYGTKGANVAYVAKDVNGYADFKDFMVMNIKNPASGVITWTERKNDITTTMLPPGNVQYIAMASGYDYSMTGINGAIAYTFCRDVVNGAAVSYHTTDISK